MIEKKILHTTDTANNNNQKTYMKMYSPVIWSATLLAINDAQMILTYRLDVTGHNFFWMMCNSKITQRKQKQTSTMKSPRCPVLFALCGSASHPLIFR